MHSSSDLLQGLQEARPRHYDFPTGLLNVSMVVRISVATLSMATSRSSKAAFSATTSWSGTSTPVASAILTISPLLGPEIMTASTEDGIVCIPCSVLWPASIMHYLFCLCRDNG